MPNAEELSRILSWLVSSGLIGFGAATTDALLHLVQPEYIGAAMVLVNIVWRLARPPVVS